MYTYNPSKGTVVRDADGVQVAPSSDDQNQNYLAWLAWCADGNEPAIDNTVEPEVVVVPSVVSPWQIRKALNQLELRDPIEAFVAQQSRDVRDGWEFATEFRRDDELLNAMAPYLSLDLDAIFILAATL